MMQLLTILLLLKTEVSLLTFNIITIKNNFITIIMMGDILAN